jgi:hypothetical protein
MRGGDGFVRLPVLKAGDKLDIVVAVIAEVFRDSAL